MARHGAVHGALIAPMYQLALLGPLAVQQTADGIQQAAVVQWFQTVHIHVQVHATVVVENEIADRVVATEILRVVSEKFTVLIRVLLTHESVDRHEMAL